MTDKTLGRLVGAAIVLLVAAEFLGWLSELWGGVAGTLAAVGVAGVTVFCGRMARVGVGNVAWFLVPTLLFTVIPVVAKIWTYTTADRTVLEELWRQAPFALGFLAPIGALAVVYMALRERA